MAAALEQKLCHWTELALMGDFYDMRADLLPKISLFSYRDFRAWLKMQILPERPATLTDAFKATALYLCAMIPREATHERQATYRGVKWHDLSAHYDHIKDHSAEILLALKSRLKQLMAITYFIEHHEMQMAGVYAHPCYLPFVRHEEGHPYVKKEFEKCVEYLKGRPSDKLPFKTTDAIIDDKMWPFVGEPTYFHHHETALFMVREELARKRLIPHFWA